jgi:hypothetical protein
VPGDVGDGEGQRRAYATGPSDWPRTVGLGRWLYCYLGTSTDGDRPMYGVRGSSLSPTRFFGTSIVPPGIRGGPDGHRPTGGPRLMSKLGAPRHAYIGARGVQAMSIRDLVKVPYANCQCIILVQY